NVNRLSIFLLSLSGLAPTDPPCDNARVGSSVMPYSQSDLTLPAPSRGSLLAAGYPPLTTPSHGLVFRPEKALALPTSRKARFPETKCHCAFRRSFRAPVRVTCTGPCPLPNRDLIAAA